jgi:hypothetical protein
MLEFPNNAVLNRAGSTISLVLDVLLGDAGDDVLSAPLAA